MSKFLNAAAGIVSVFLISCSKPPLPPPPAPAKPLAEIITDAEKGGPVDLTFSIRSRETLPDGSQALHAYGAYHGREVGLTVVLGTEWKSASLGSDVPLVTYRGIATYRGTMNYRSLGAPSDALLQALDELFDTRLQPAAMRQNTPLTAISLAGEPGDLAKGPAKIKLFFEPDAHGNSAEIYTNIDLAKGLLQIGEKDLEFRPAIIEGLRKK